MSGERGRASSAARRLIAWLLPAEDRPLLEELDELYTERVARKGVVGARLWFWREALGFLARLGPGRVREVVSGFAAALQLGQVLAGLRRRPRWAVGVAGTLAVGVGGLATVFAVANWVLLRPVPGVADDRDLVTLRIGSSRDPAHVTYRISHPDVQQLEQQLTTLEAIAASAPGDVHVQSEGAPARRLAAEMVTTNFFDVLRVRLAAGRGFSLEEGASSDGAPVVIVSHALARDIAGEAVRAVGSTLRINGRAVSVIGVTPPGFRGASLPGRASLWFPLGAHRLLDPDAPANASARPTYGIWRLMYGRTTPDASHTVVQAQAEQARARIVELSRAHSFIPTHFRLQVFEGIGLDPGVRASVRGTLRILGLSALLLLVLAVANVVNLSIIESLHRRTAMAVRFSLGARMRHIAAHWIAESLVVAVLAAALALTVARLLAAAFSRTQLDSNGASLEGLGFDVRVIAFTLLVTIVVALLAGLPVLLTASRIGTLATLARSRSGDSGSQRVRGAFVVVQVALSVMLLIGAGLLARTVMNLRAIDLGFPIDNATVFTIDPTTNRYTAGEAAALIDRLQRRFEDRTEIEAVGFLTPAPLLGFFTTDGIYPVGGSSEDQIIAAGYRASPGFFAALRPSLIVGDLSAALASDAIVISRSLASEVFPGVSPQDVVGRVVHGRGEDAPLLRIAGIIDDVHLNGLREEDRQDPPSRPLPWKRHTIIHPLRSDDANTGPISGWIRSSAAPSRVAGIIMDVMRAEAPDLPVHRLQTARAATDLLSSERLMLARIAVVLSALGLLLAAGGLYAAIGCIVQQRVREIGIRAALGASPLQLLRSVTARGVALAVGGACIGFLGALALARGLQSYLFGVSAFDAPVYAVATAGVIAAAAFASAIPARRAARVSPLEVIRAE